jgi:hypothetical protein
MIALMAFLPWTRLLVAHGCAHAKTLLTLRSRAAKGQGHARNESGQGPPCPAQSAAMHCGGAQPVQASPGKAPGGITSEFHQAVLGRSPPVHTRGIGSPRVCLGAMAWIGAQRGM